MAFLIGYNYPQLANGDKRAEIITSIILQLLFSQGVFGKPIFKKKLSAKDLRYFRWSKIRFQLLKENKYSIEEDIDVGKGRRKVIIALVRTTKLQQRNGTVECVDQTKQETNETCSARKKLDRVVRRYRGQPYCSAKRRGWRRLCSSRLAPSRLLSWKLLEESPVAELYHAQNVILSLRP